MNQLPRPTQITSILETISSNGYAEISSELESYIADLEAKQPHRPAYIAALLNAAGSQSPDSLEAFNSEPEAKQQVIPSDNQRTPASNPYNLPIWSYKRKPEREQRHRR